MTQRILAITCILFAVQLMPCLIGHLSFLMNERAKPSEGVLIRGRLVMKEGSRYEVIDGELIKSGNWSQSFVGDHYFFGQIVLGFGLCLTSILISLIL